MNDGPMVRCIDVHKSFGKLEVLRGLTMDVARGEVVVVIGASGSGKSTLLRCINHLERLDFGYIYVDGALVGYREKDGKLVEDSEPEIARKRAEIGIVFQRFNLFPHLTALGNVIEAPVHVRKVPKARPKQRGASAARARRPLGEGGRAPGQALRRPAAARRDRPRAGDGAEADAVRRAHVGARPGARRRGPGRDEGPRRGRHDDDRRHPRDGLRPRSRRPRRLHGRGRDRGGGPTGRGASQSRSTSGRRRSSRGFSSARSSRRPPGCASPSRTTSRRSRGTARRSRSPRGGRGDPSGCRRRSSRGAAVLP